MFKIILPLHHSKAHCRLHQQSRKHHYRSPQERYGPPSCRCMARRTQSPRRPLTATVRRALQLLIDNIYKHIDRFVCPSINKCPSLHRNQSLKQKWKAEYKKLQRRKYVVRTTARRPWPAPTPTRLVLTRKRSRTSATVSAQEWEIWKGRVAPSSVPASSTVWQQKTRSKP